MSLMSSMTESTLRIKGQRCHVRVHGEGEPLLMLHGFSGDSTTWDAFRANIGSGFRLIAPDLLGHGKSAAPADSERYRMSEAAADMIALLDLLGSDRAHLLGYSMGGRLALCLALRYPSRFNSLIMESASPGMANEAERAERRQQDEALARRIESDGIDAFVDFWESLPLWESQRTLTPETRLAQRNQRLRNGAIGLANSLRGMGAGAQPSLWHELPGLRMPTLLLVGEGDHKFRAINEQMAGHMPKAELRLISGAGHNTHLEQPAQFAARVRSFLQRV